MMRPQNLIGSLEKELEKMIQTVEEQLLPLNEDKLNWRPAPGKWSILECIEHLNRYNHYYNPALEKAIKTGQAGKAVTFRPGWLGNYFVKMIDPENSKAMKTVSHMDPVGSNLNKNTLRTFLEYQRQLQSLLTAAETANLNRRAVPLEFFRLIKLKTGDALHFVITHQRRHLLQVQGILELISSEKKVSSASHRPSL